jgi:NAD-dependent dihydropyrimidine dehydrogenase PreA subunit
MFIKVEVDETRCIPDGGIKLVGVCPVKVFALEDGRVVTEPDNEDECTLCRLCLEMYPEGAVTIRRLYRDE